MVFEIKWSESQSILLEIYLFCFPWVTKAFLWGVESTTPILDQGRGQWNWTILLQNCDDSLTPPLSYKRYSLNNIYVIRIRVCVCITLVLVAWSGPSLRRESFGSIDELQKAWQRGSLEVLSYSEWLRSGNTQNVLHGCGRSGHPPTHFHKLRFYRIMPIQVFSIKSKIHTSKL